VLKYVEKEQDNAESIAIHILDERNPLIKWLGMKKGEIPDENKKDRRYAGG
jgi:hypothetical protein